MNRYWSEFGGRENIRGQYLGYDKGNELYYRPHGSRAVCGDIHKDPACGGNIVLLHVFSTTLAQAPLVVIILIFYKAKKQVRSVLA